MANVIRERAVPHLPHTKTCSVALAFTQAATAPQATPGPFATSQAPRTQQELVHSGVSAAQPTGNQHLQRWAQHSERNSVARHLQSQLSPKPTNGGRQRNRLCAPQVPPNLHTGDSRPENPNEETPKTLGFSGSEDAFASLAMGKWAMRDSNPRLHPCKGCTLAN